VYSKKTYAAEPASMRVMLDTNAFNALLDFGLDGHALPFAEYFCTHLQKAELRATRNSERRDRLLDRFATVNEEVGSNDVEQHSTPWDSPWDSPWDRGGALYRRIRDELERKKPRNRGNSYDAVLVETCKYDGLTLVSDDETARDVARAFGVEVLSLAEFLARS
jgi:rRNA-processing protein FCF1